MYDCNYGMIRWHNSGRSILRNLSPGRLPSQRQNLVEWQGLYFWDRKWADSGMYSLYPCHLPVFNLYLALNLLPASILPRVHYPFSKLLHIPTQCANLKSNLPTPSAQAPQFFQWRHDTYIFISLLLRCAQVSHFLCFRHCIPCLLSAAISTYVIAFCENDEEHVVSNDSEEDFVALCTVEGGIGFAVDLQVS